MPSTDDLVSWENLRGSDASLQKLVPPPTPLPDAVKKRFPELLAWEKSEQERMVKINIALQGGIP